MKVLNSLALLALVAFAAATPALQEDEPVVTEEEVKPEPARRSYPPKSYCPVDYCTINTSYDPYYNYAYLRQNPCNNKSPIMTLYDGDVVYDLGGPAKYGCGYYYKQVLVTSGYTNKVGWVGAQFLSCKNGNYPPAPAAAMVTPTQGKYS